MNIRRAKTEIEESVYSNMEKYRQVSEWQDAARRDAFADASQYEQRKKQLSDIVECLKQAEEALERAILLEEKAHGEQSDSKEVSDR